MKSEALRKVFNESSEHKTGEAQRVEQDGENKRFHLSGGNVKIDVNDKISNNNNRFIRR